VSGGRDVRAEFAEAVNMSTGELQRWLDTEESKRVGQHRDGTESVGHESGRRISRCCATRTSRPSAMSSTCARSWATCTVTSRSDRPET